MTLGLGLRFRFGLYEVWGGKEGGQELRLVVGVGWGGHDYCISVQQFNLNVLNSKRLERAIEPAELIRLDRRSNPAEPIQLDRRPNTPRTS